KSIPYFPLDALFGGLANGAPQLGVVYDQSPIDRAEKMWPVAKPLLGFFLQQEKDFLIEGDTILPKQVYEVMQEGGQIRSCFVGYTELSVEEKFALIRKHHQGALDWTKNIPDNKMQKYVDEMIEFSKYLKEECSKYNI